MIILQDELLSLLDGTVQGLRRAVEVAIKLEHATIPVYLYALYSLLPSSNLEIAQIIRSIVVEEMLHMTIACNILNAIDGKPLLDTPDFLPKYPGALPGGVEQNLQVSLAPASLSLIRDVFMMIEEPEFPLKFPSLKFAEAETPKTIGMFYKRISDQLQEQFFTGNPGLQVAAEWWPSNQLFAITNVDTARSAIQIIIEQGEGTDLQPTDLEGEYAHYYRFSEIAHGRRLVKNPNAGRSTSPDQQYIYAGAVVPFDPSKVQPLIVNPALTPYTPGSAAQVANDAFNATYVNLLRCLQAVFTGHPQRLRNAIGIMESLKEQAIAITRIPLKGDMFAGPTFEYRAVN